jgi:hypothetical protein
MTLFRYPEEDEVRPSPLKKWNERGENFVPYIFWAKHETKKNFQNTYYKQGYIAYYQNKLWNQGKVISVEDGPVYVHPHLNDNIVEFAMQVINILNDDSARDFYIQVLQGERLPTALENVFGKPVSDLIFLNKNNKLISQIEKKYREDLSNVDASTIQNALGDDLQYVLAATQEEIQQFKNFSEQFGLRPTHFNIIPDPKTPTPRPIDNPDSPSSSIDNQSFLPPPKYRRKLQQILFLLFFLLNPVIFFISFIWKKSNHAAYQIFVGLQYLIWIFLSVWVDPNTYIALVSIIMFGLSLFAYLFWKQCKWGMSQKCCP